MQRPRSIAFVPVMIALAFSGLTLPANARPIRVMMIGDSLTHDVVFDVATYLGPTYQTLGSQMLKRTVNGRSVYSEGHNGWRSDQIATNITLCMEGKHPEVVTLMAGTNDIRHFTADQTIANLKHALNTVHALDPTAFVLLSTIPPRKLPGEEGFNIPINQGIRAVPRHRWFRVVNVGGALTGADLGPDRIHPTLSGWAKLGHLWAKEIRRHRSRRAYHATR